MKLLLTLLTVTLLMLLTPLPDSVRAVYWDIGRKGWLQLEEMRNYVCGMSSDAIVANYTRGKPWFCVEPSECRMTTSPLPPILNNSQPENKCDALRYNENRTRCCYIGALKEPLQVGEVDHSTYILNTGDARAYSGLASLNEYKDFLSGTYEGDTREKSQALENHVCGLIPTSKVNSTTLYVPYICIQPANCTAKFPISTPLRFNHGDHFCRRQREVDLTESRICCHLSALVNHSDTGETWAYTELPSSQKYASGFKSSFMCEQYNRFVCEGKADRCPLRILDRHAAVPGEFPHQALVGVTSHRIQFFYCAGSLVSKNFIISAFDCRTYNGIAANIVLLGDYQLAMYREQFSREQITYIDGHFSKREFHFMILLRLWRPVTFNYLLRPSCLDWVPSFNYSMKVTARYYNFGVGWLTGYGPTNKDDPFNTTLKRYRYKFKELKALNYCIAMIPDSKKIKNFNLITSDSHICAVDGRRYSPINLPDSGLDPKSGQGYFDMGAPFSVLKNYCQWNLYGVSIQNPRLVSKSPVLIETLQDLFTFEHLESIIFSNEHFDLLEFNLTFPDCAVKDIHNFNNMKFLNRSYKYLYNY